MYSIRRSRRSSFATTWARARSWPTRTTRPASSTSLCRVVRPRSAAASTTSRPRTPRRSRTYRATPRSEHRRLPTGFPSVPPDHREPSSGSPDPVADALLAGAVLTLGGRGKLRRDPSLRLAGVGAGAPAPARRIAPPVEPVLPHQPDAAGLDQGLRRRYEERASGRVASPRRPRKAEKSR